MIVESPVKAKTILKIVKSFSQDSWNIVASGGYIKELTKKNALNFSDSGFEAQWVYNKGKKDFVDKLKKSIHSYDNVYIATDDDIEGEKIAYDLVEALEATSIYKRIAFNSITSEAIQHSLNNPREIDRAKYKVACSRRYIDRDEGYGISDVLRFDFEKKQINYPPSLAVGRSISPALHLIAENDRIIKEFEPEEYIRIKIRYLKGTVSFEHLHTKRFLKTNRDDQMALELFLRQISTSRHKVAGFIPKQENEAPPEPLYTATLQSAAFSVFGFSAKETMSMAQSLHENGLITYHRTDSNEISEASFEKILDYLYETEDADDIYDTKRKYKKRNNSQESHEAILVSIIEEKASPKNIVDFAKKQFGFNITSKMKMLYELIWYRTISTQMVDAIYDRSTMKIDAGGNIFELRANSIITQSGSDGTEKKMLGWLKNKGELLEPSAMTEGEEYKYKEIKLPRLNVLDTVQVLEIAPISTKTRAPHRYGEGRFITTLESLGIARPSSLSGIVPSLEEKGLVIRINGVIHLKKLGDVVDEWVTRYCSWLNSIDGVKEFVEALEKDRENNEDDISVLYEYHEKIEELKKEIGYIEKEERVYPPSEAQIKIAKQIAIRKKVIIKEECYENGKLMSEFISDHIENDDKKYLGVCPECKKGKILENSKAFGCNQFKSGCKFTIWKNSCHLVLKNYGIIPDDIYLRDIVKSALKGEPVVIKDNIGLYIEKHDNKWNITPG